MSSVDERVASLRLDNTDFKKHAAESIKTISQLEKSLKTADNDASFAKMEKSLVSINKWLNPLSNRLSKFVGKQLDEMERSAKNFVNSLTLDQVNAGFSKYEQKTKAIQTILAAVESQGKGLDDVTKAVEKLNKYTDETSYSFTEMISSIGKFTANGIDLEVAERAMEGIANEAARSGVGIQGANHAMYNFSQSLATGAVQLMDWKSIENANMATKEFKQTIIETAKEIGTLDKNGKTKKGTLVDFQTFNSTLSEKWFTSDVLIKTLEKYSDTTTEFGRKAFEAAQKALTFTDAVDAIKDATSTGWMNTFGYIFGDLDESIELWTNFCNAIIDTLSPLDEARNAMFKLWHDQGGRTKLLDGIAKSFRSVLNVARALGDAFSKIFPPVTEDTLLSISEKIYEIGTYLEDMFKYEDHFRGFTTTIEQVEKVTEAFDQLERGAKGESVKKLQELLVALGYDIGKSGVDGIFGKKTQAAIKKFQKDCGLAETGVFDLNTQMVLFEKLGTDAVKEFINQAVQVPKIVSEVSVWIEYIQRIGSGAFAVLDLIGKGFSFIASAAFIAVDAFSPLVSAILAPVAALSDWNVAINESIEKSTVFSGALDKIREFFKPISNWAQGASDTVKNFFENTIHSEEFAKSLEKLDRKFRQIKRRISKSEGWNKLVNAFTSLKAALSPLLPDFNKLGATFKSIISDKISEKLSLGLEWTANNLPIWVDVISKNLSVLIDNFVDFVNNFPDTFPSTLDFLKSLGKSILDSFSTGQLKVNGIFDFFSNIYNSVMNAINSTGDSFDSAVIELKSKFDPIFNFPSWLGDRLAEFGENSVLIEGIHKASDFLNKLDIGNILLLWGSFLAGKRLLSLAKEINSLISSGTKALTSIISSGTTTLTSISKYIDAKTAVFKRDKLSKTLKSFGTTMLMFAAAVGIIAYSMYKLGQLPKDELEQGKNTVYELSVLLVTVAVSIGALDKMLAGSGNINIGGELFKMAIAIGILGWVVTKFAAMENPEKALEGIKAVGWLLLELVGFSVILSKFEATNIDIKGMIGLSVAIGILAFIAVKLNDIDLGTGLKNLGWLLAELVAFVIGLNALSKGPANYKGLIGLAIAVGLFAFIAVQLGKIDFSYMIQALIKMAGVVVIMKSLISGLNKSTGGITNYKGLISMAVMLVAFVGALWAVGSMPISTIVKGLLGLLGASFVLKLLIKQLNGISNGISFKSTASFIVMLIGVVGLMFAFSVALNGIKSIDPAIIISFGLSIAAMLYTMSFLSKSASIGKMGNIAMSLVGIIGVMAAFVLALGYIKDIKTETIVAFAASISAILIAAGAFAALSSFTNFGGVAAALVGFIGILAIAAGVFIALGKLLEDTKNFEFASSTVTKLGTLIGEFSGAMKAAEIDKLSDGLNSFSNLEINEDGIQNAISAAGLVRDFAATLEKGALKTIVDSLFGSDLSHFSDDMKNFAGGVVALADGLNGVTIDKSNVEAATDAAKLVSKLANTLGKTEIDAAIADKIAGGTPFDRFIRSLPRFAASVGIFGKVASLIPSDISTTTDPVVDAATKIAKLANVFKPINIDQALADKIAGGTPFDSFIKSIGPFGKAIADLAPEIANVPDTIASDIQPTIDAATKIAELVDTIGGMANLEANRGAFLTWFAGDTKANTVFEAMGKLGGYINDMRDQIEGLNSSTILDDITTLRIVTSSVAQLMTYLSSLTTVDTKTFSLRIFDIGEFGETIHEFSEEISGINPMSFSIIATGFNNLVDALSTINTEDFMVELDGSGVAQRINEFTETVSSSLNTNVASLSENASAFMTSGEELLGAFTRGFETGNTGTNTMKQICLSMTMTVRLFHGQMSDAGNYFGSGLADGLNRSKIKAVVAARLVAQSVVNTTKTVLDEHSPSKIGDQIGVFWDMGLANGLVRFAGHVQAASARVSNEIVTTTGSRLSTMSSLISDNLDADPVIRPVVDMSDVTASAKAIGGMMNQSSRISLSTDEIRKKASASTAYAKNNQNGSSSSVTTNNYSTSNSVNFDGPLHIRNEFDLKSLANQIAGLLKDEKASAGTKTIG